jgi:hypothetical protein
LNDAQRELLSKGLAGIAKGIFVAAPIAMGTGKLSVACTLTLMVLTIDIFNIGSQLAGGNGDD